MIIREIPDGQIVTEPGRQGQKPIRPIRVTGDIAYVRLTKGYEAIIDAADVSLVDGRNWCANVTRGLIYALSGSPKTYLHRLITGVGAGFEVDHRDGNGLNNRRGNLRISTHAENLRNRGVQRNSASGIKGVCWDKSAKGWRAQIGVDGQMIYLGTFREKGLARSAYAAAALKYHGQHGRS